MIDLLIQGILLLALTLALSLAGTAVSPDLGVFLFGVGTLVVVAIVVGFYIVFEALNGGRTPGKAALGIRVVSVDGTSLSLVAVTLRTLMRLVDFLPAAYAIGAISIVTSARNQRLGDLIANTVVVRDRTPVPSAAAPMPQHELRGWDVSAVGDAEIGLVRRWAARRADLNHDARQNLARELAGRLRPRVGGGRELDDETFLLQLLAEKQGRPG
jgi:uncharacterized RDD family membrane protein YckC